MKEKNDPLRPLRPNPHNLRITYELFNRLRERMFLGPLCVGIGRGADDVLDLREGYAVVYESDDCEGYLSPDGSGWTADVEEKEEEGPEYDKRCWRGDLEVYIIGKEGRRNVRSWRNMKMRWMRS
jgi:hypothetical protein